MSSPNTDNQINFAAAGAPLTSVAVSQSGAAIIDSLDLSKDSGGAIKLDTSNLQKLAAANLISYDSKSDSYSLNVALLAPANASILNPTIVETKDGVWSISSATSATKALLTTAAPNPTQVETTPLGAVQLQLAAPLTVQQNPYLDSRQAKLMIAMCELFAIQAKIAVYDNQSSQKTFTRAIENVQTKQQAIENKYAAQDMRIKGDEVAAEMTIGVIAIGMLLQAGALLGIKLLDSSSKRPSQTGENEADSPSFNENRLTLTEDERQQQRQETQSTTAASRSGSERSGEVSNDVERNAQSRSGDQSHMEQAQRLTLTPENQERSSSKIGSKLSDFARENLKNILGQAGLGEEFEEAAKNYVAIVHSQTNIAGNKLEMVADQQITGLDLQSSLIKQQLSANKTQHKETMESVERLVDLVTSLSRQSLDSERTLFRS